MSRTLRHVLLALALLCSQQAAQLHALSHTARDLTVALGGEKSAPPLGHPAAQCIAFHAIDSALSDIAPLLVAQHAVPSLVASFSLPPPFAPRIVFDSRAPPSLS